MLDRLYHLSIDHFVNYRKHFKEYFWAIIIALTLRAILVTIYQIPTGSMIPTFNVKDVLIANRFYFGLKLPFTDNLPGYRLPAFREPRIGDVLIFRAPNEDKFYSTKIKILHPQGLRTLMKINEEAKNYNRVMYFDTKHLIYLSTDPLQMGEISDLILHQDLYKKHHKQLLSNPHIQFVSKDWVSHRLHQTYYENKPQPIFKHLLDTPISGLSIVGTVLLNSPFAYGIKYLVVSVVNAISSDFNLSFFYFSLYPNDLVVRTKDYVKRVIAKGEDIVEIRNKKVFVNGIERPMNKLLYTENEKKREIFYPIRIRDNIWEASAYFTGSQRFNQELWPYQPQFISFHKDNFGPITVPKGHYFVLGDNRDESLDSRYWGCVPRWAVKGTAMIKILPIKDFGLIR